MKKKYVRPVIIEFQNLTSQAIGATSCSPNGSSATGGCNQGNSANGDCSQGGSANGSCNNGTSASGYNCFNGSSAVQTCGNGGSAVTHGKKSALNCNNGETPGNDIICMIGNNEESYFENQSKYHHNRKVGNGTCDLGNTASSCFSGQEPGIQESCYGGASPIHGSCSSGYEANKNPDGCSNGGIPGQGNCNHGIDHCGNGMNDTFDSSCFSGSFAGPEDCSMGGKNLTDGCVNGFGEEGCQTGNNPYSIPCLTGGLDCLTGYSAN